MRVSCLSVGLLVKEIGVCLRLWVRYDSGQCCTMNCIKKLSHNWDFGCFGLAKQTKDEV